jgi:REP element-mobilizing transposase RayT
MADRPLTRQQQTVLEFLSTFQLEHGYPPTLREIGDAVGLANINAVRGHLAALEKKGRIIRTPDKARSIQVVHAPSPLSRVKRRLHQILGTDKGVFHRVVFGLAWATQGGKPILEGPPAKRLGELLDREAAEHGWTILETRIEPDHVVVIVETWPDHSAQRAVQCFQSAGNGIKRSLLGRSARSPLWGRGYVATTDLELLNGLIGKLLEAQGAAN